MSLRLYEPNTLLNRLHDEIGRMFDDGMNVGELTSASNAWSPAVDIQEEENRYVLNADLPGVNAEDIDITLEHGVLTIQGERKAEQTSEDKRGYRRIERFHGRFVRSFALPDTADNEKVDARLKDGVLHVIIDKKERAKPRRIAVKH